MPGTVGAGDRVLTTTNQGSGQNYLGFLYTLKDTNFVQSLVSATSSKFSYVDILMFFIPEQSISTFYFLFGQGFKHTIINFQRDDKVSPHKLLTSFN